MQKNIHLFLLPPAFRDIRPPRSVFGSVLQRRTHWLWSQVGRGLVDVFSSDVFFCFLGWQFEFHWVSGSRLNFRKLLIWFAYSPSWEFVSTRPLSNFGSPQFSLLTFEEGKKTWVPSYHKGVWTANGHLLWGLKGDDDMTPAVHSLSFCAMRDAMVVLGRHIFARPYIYIHIQKLFSNRCRFLWNGKHNVERNRRIWNDITWKSSHSPVFRSNS